jgi:hypothetical protein
MVKVYHELNFVGFLNIKAAMDTVEGRENLIKKFEASRLIAEVDTDDLEVAFEKTNNINCPWIDNPEVKVAEGVNRVRSTSVGDFVVLNDDIYIVDAIGFTKIN